LPIGAQDSILPHTPDHDATKVADPYPVISTTFPSLSAMTASAEDRDPLRPHPLDQGVDGFARSHRYRNARQPRRLSRRRHQFQPHALAEGQNVRPRLSLKPALIEGTRAVEIRHPRRNVLDHRVPQL
jgi:hypothetical protein